MWQNISFSACRFTETCVCFVNVRSIIEPDLLPSGPFPPLPLYFPLMASRFLIQPIDVFFFF